MDFKRLSQSQEFKGCSWDRDEAKLTGVSISSIAETQANFNKEPVLLSLNVCVNACKGHKFHNTTAAFEVH